MMEELLPFYERELALLRRSMQTFATRYPKIVARLAITGEHSEDPHVERLLQSFALLGARIEAKIEDDYPEFAEAMLEVLYPQYLRPFPSCSIAQFDIGGLVDEMTAPRTINRGVQFTAVPAGYLFRSAYDVVLSPVRITDARYALTPFSPSSVSVPAGTTGILSISFACAAESGGFGAAPARVRVHLSGQREVVAAVADGLLMRTTAAFVEPDSCGTWKPLRQLPVSAVGFDEDDALLDGPQDATSPMRLLLEYFAFPDRFDFVDIDLSAARRVAGPCERLTLHLAITRTHPDSWAAQRMATLKADNLQLFCTPVINLFQCSAAAVETAEGKSHYPVVPQATHISDLEVWSVNSVRVIDSLSSGETEIRPFGALLHGSSAQLAGPYWTLNRDAKIAQENPGYETELGLVGVDGMPAAIGATELGIELTCTNRNLPSALSAGSELSAQALEPQTPVRLLRRPTASVRATRHDGALWRLISHMAPQAVRIDKAGLADLKRLFHQFASLSGSHVRHIDGIVNLSRRPTMLWMVMKPCPSLVRGIEVTLTVDEQAFAGSSLSTFASVMDRFFSSYVPEISCVQLVLISANTGVELQRCAARQGLMPIV